MRHATRPHIHCPLDDLSPEEMAARRFKQGDLGVLKDWELRHFRAQESIEARIERMATQLFTGEF